LEKKYKGMKHTIFTILSIVILAQWGYSGPVEGEGDTTLVLKKTITGDIRPKSVVCGAGNLAFAQNMMYRHTVTVYDTEGLKLKKTISDKIKLSDYGVSGHKGLHEGSPVEAAFAPDGASVWVSNYQMFGDDFDSPGSDNCKMSSKYDSSYVYKISTKTLEIESIVRVGCVPKYVAVTPDGSKVLVSNWCSGDLSVVDTKTEKEVKRIAIGRYPRGIVVDPGGQYAYVAVMGSTKIAVVRLSDYKLYWIQNVGNQPRHLCMSPTGKYLYVTLNTDGKVAKVDLTQWKVVSSVKTGKAPRSMDISSDGSYLYVVNYLGNSMSKVQTSDMKVLETVKTKTKPIGISFDAAHNYVWVACYTGSIMVFEDTSLGGDVLASAESPLGEEVMGSDFASGTQNNYLYPYRPVVPPPTAAASEIPSRKSTPAKAAPEKKSPAKKEPVKKEPVVKKAVPKVNKAGDYHVVVGSFGSKVNASKKVKELNAEGIGGVILEASGGKFRVTTGGFGSKALAVEEVKRLKELGIGGWVLSPNTPK